MNNLCSYMRACRTLHPPPTPSFRAKKQPERRGVQSLVMKRGSVFASLRPASERCRSTVRTILATNPVSGLVPRIVVFIVEQTPFRFL